ncbi:rRNA biogenesis protein RRP5 isoform X2 [Typha angustifolia]|uniref:rRNA biogenesis protein RRP5 isoform X2 n=1 Tax=Typha angustifolia TaxID=59011 RepID=UPI003C2DD5A3
MAAVGENRKKSSRKRNPGEGRKPEKSFKNTRKDKADPSSTDLPSSLLIPDEDPDFPRGGGSILSREEAAEARAEAEAEFEREEMGPARGKDNRKKKGARKPSSGRAEEDFGSLFGEGVTGKLPRFANRITLKNISPNMKLWGVIIEVNPKDLVISLPGGLRGFVRAEEVSDIDKEYSGSESDMLSSIVHIGQLVSCFVLRVDDDKKDGKGNKRIWLSLRLSLLHKCLSLDAVQDGMVLTAQVKSVEDHGYILYFGVPSFSGFMPRTTEDGGRIKCGQLLQRVVKSIDKARGVVYLNSDPELGSKFFTKDLKGLSIDLLVPGMMVNARVHSTLENGIMLSFLTYFTGTVDIFHLPNAFPTGTWKNDYKQNTKVIARILFIDPSTRAVGLTLNPYLVHNKIPPLYVNTGEIFDHSRILRVDKGVGLLLELPSSPAPSPGYANIHDVSDEEVLKLEKKFKEGSTVRVRVLGTRRLEGLSMSTLKASAFEGSIFTHADVKPGMLVKAKVIAVENFGAIVQFSSGVKALCPLPHMSELDIVKTPKKFKVGVELLFRVLGCKSKRITVTHKKTLVKSKLTVLASYTDATEGLITHGWITKIEKHGCFVRFYNGVQGFAHRSQLGLEPGTEAESIYHIGQVIKCRIISSVPASRRISVSFVISPKRTDVDEKARLGSLVTGVVDRMTSGAVIVNVNGYYKGTIFNEHLSDNQAQATLLRSLLKPGYEFDQLLVLDIEAQNLVLSAKYSLIKSAKEIPLDISMIQHQSVIHGYICNIIEAGCFVRFLGRLTGFCPKQKGTDEQTDNISDAFYVGQSVRSHILSVDTESGRIKLSLQQSLCFSSDVSFLQGYFLLEEKIAALHHSNSKNSYINWMESFNIGSLVEGEIEEIKEYGIVLRFKDHGEVVGFVANHQLGGINVELGSVVKALILDISKSDGLVDLSLKPELIDSAKIRGSKKKRCRATSADLKLHQEVNAIVEIMKENYLILSVPEYNYAIGYASLTDYNIQKLPHKHFTNGQSVTVTVGELSSAHFSGRLLLLLKTFSDVSGSSFKKSRKKSGYRVGSLVEAEIVEIKPLELILKFGIAFRGRVHVTEVVDTENSMENPLSKFKIGEMLHARIVAKAEQSGKSGKAFQWELSLRPSVLEDCREGISPPKTEEFDFSVGAIAKGYVVKVDSDWVWLTVSRHFMAHLYILDSSSEPSELEGFQQRYAVGEAVKGCILNINKEKKLLRLKSCPSLFCESMANQESFEKNSQAAKGSNITGTEHINQGDIVGGRIKRLLPGVGGILVQIGPHLYGRAHYTELLDTWVPEPLARYQEGQFVKCKILDITRSSEGTIHVDLSLRPSLQAIQPVVSTESGNSLEISKRFEKMDDLHPDMDVQGYVKNVTSKGCFIMLSRTVDARVLLSNLSDSYIEDPEKEFPVGKLVHGRVLSVEPSLKRVEVTLRTDVENKHRKLDSAHFNNFHAGDIVHGQIRRTESYGLFITIDNSSLVGLCHISELSDEPINDIETRYKAGDKVLAKVLKVDADRHRISLGMKRSYIGDASDAEIAPNYDIINNTIDETAPVDDVLLAFQQNNLTWTPAIPTNRSTDFAIRSEIEKRASVLPLDVNLGESDGSDLDNDASVSLDSTNKNEVVGKESDRRIKKKAKEQRELEISAAEQRSLQKVIPSTADEFEKLVRSSPNSSFVWINYMAFMLDLADIEKARSIAERALRTINVREEEEKLNIWVAYFNLENEYGSPPEEAVKKTFQRALQYCDPKKLHFALLGMYERTEQQKLADELLERMIKKFKTSCKVWLRYAQSFLKQGKNEIQSVVNRTLLSLPRNKHIKFISQIAILEFKCGVPERGRSMFESVLREYPKRTDLWSIYLDQEIRLGDKEVIRALFERATCLSLPPKKMKFLFKKYLEYEKTQGDEDRIEHVKSKALEYVESSLT